MRVTFHSLNRHMQHVIQDRYRDLTKLQEQLSTGKRLLRPSDDPIDVTNDLKLRSKVAQFVQFNDNIDDGMAFMAVTDTSMVSMNELLQRVRELAIQAASDTKGAQERLFIQKEIEQLLRQMIALADTNYKGDYIFGGTQTKIAPFPVGTSLSSDQQDYANLAMVYYDPGTAAVPFALDQPIQLRDAFDPTQTIEDIIPGTFEISAMSGGTRVTFVEGRDYTIDYVAGTITILSTGIDHAALNVDVSDAGAFGGPNYNYNTGIRITLEHIDIPRDIYRNPVANDGLIYREIENDIVVPINITGDELFNDYASGNNALETLIRFSQRLIQNDTMGIEASITEIDMAFNTILSAQAKNGAKMNRFDLTLTRNEEQCTETTRLLSEIEDADMAEVISKFSLTETVYNAALKSAARVIQPSLVDFL